MCRLSTFFKDASSEPGVFYPNGYLLAIFPNLAEAEHARKALDHTGPNSVDSISASDDEIVHFAEANKTKEGVWATLLADLSRAIGAGAVYSDQDLAAARNGAALVGVHCPTDESKPTAWRLLEPSHPIAARYYTSGGIEHL